MIALCHHPWADEFADPDDQWHQCAEAPGHDGRHRCACGAVTDDTEATWPPFAAR